MYHEILAANSAKSESLWQEHEVAENKDGLATFAHPITPSLYRIRTPSWDFPKTNFLACYGEFQIWTDNENQFRNN